MKTLYLECNMGIAGDMLMSALWELVDDKDTVLEEINNISIPHTSVSFEKFTSCSISGFKANVLIDGEPEDDGSHHSFHRNLSDVKSVIDSLCVNENVKISSKAVYDIIAQAESKAHNESVEQIHFHEVGMLDAIADIVICNYLIDKLKIEKVITSPINAGNSTVKCAHGVFPVPAPATADILRFIPFYKSDIQSELCTPTGAALVKYHSSSFGNMPVMYTQKIGYGFGKKEFDIPNCVRAFLGETEDDDNNVAELACNIDDMTPEDISSACDILMNNGALDVSTQPVMMKKGRYGFILKVICSEEIKRDMVKLIFRHTSTIGIREYICKRYVLSREVKSVSTPFGNVRVKYSNGYNCSKIKIESDDLLSIAKSSGKSVRQIKEAVISCLE